MVVDRVVPEQGLVAVAPGVVLGADVLVGVLDALLEGGHVRPVLPVLGPEVVRVGAGEDQAGDDAAVWSLADDFLAIFCVCPCAPDSMLGIPLYSAVLRGNFSRTDSSAMYGV